MPMPCEDDVGDVSKLPANVAAGKQLLHQYRELKWKSERGLPVPSAMTARLNARIEELEDALAGVELEAEDYRFELAERDESVVRLEAVLDAERAAGAVRSALHAEEVRATAELCRAQGTKQGIVQSRRLLADEMSVAIETEELVAKLGASSLRALRQRDSARVAHAEALATSAASEKCVGALVHEVETMCRAVQAQSAASDALVAGAEAATKRAERAERRADAADERRLVAEENAARADDRALRGESDALAACDSAARGLCNRTEAQRHVVKLQGLLAESYRDFDALLVHAAKLQHSVDAPLGVANDDGALEAACASFDAAVAHGRRVAAEVETSGSAAFAALAAELEAAEEKNDDLFQQLVDAEAAASARLGTAEEDGRAFHKLYEDYKAKFELEEQATEELIATLEERDTALADARELLESKDRLLDDRARDASSAASAACAAALDDSRAVSDKARALEGKAAGLALDLAAALEDRDRLRSELLHVSVDEHADLDDELPKGARDNNNNNSNGSPDLVDAEPAAETGAIDYFEERQQLEVRLADAEAALMRAIEEAALDRQDLDRRLAEAGCEAARAATAAALHREDLEAKLAVANVAVAAREDEAASVEQHQQLQSKLAESSIAALKAMETASSQRKELETKLAESEDAAAKAAESARMEREELETKLEEANAAAARASVAATAQLAELETKLVVSTEEAAHAAEMWRMQHAELDQQLAAAAEAAAVTADTSIAERKELAARLAESNDAAARATEVAAAQREDLEAKLVEANQAASREAAATTAIREDLEAKLAEANEIARTAVARREELQTELAEANDSAVRAAETAAAQRSELEARLSAAMKDAARATEAVALQREEMELTLARSVEAAQATAIEKRLHLEARLALQDSAAKVVEIASSPAHRAELQKELAQARAAEAKVAEAQAAAARVMEAAAQDREELEARFIDAQTSAAQAALAAALERERLEDELAQAHAVAAEAARDATLERERLEDKLRAVAAESAAKAHLEHQALKEELASTRDAALEREKLGAELAQAHAAAAEAARDATFEHDKLERELAQARAAAAETAANLDLERQKLDKEVAIVRDATLEREKLKEELADARAAAAESAAKAQSQQQALEEELTSARKAVDEAAAQVSEGKALALRESDKNIEVLATMQEELAALQEKHRLALSAADAEAQASGAYAHGIMASSDAAEAWKRANFAMHREIVDDLEFKVVQLDERLAAASAANAADASHLATEATILRSALDTVKAEREALRTDTDLLQQALDRLKAENNDLKMAGVSNGANGSSKNGARPSLPGQMISEVDDKDKENGATGTPRASKEGHNHVHTHNASVVSSVTGPAPASPAAIEALRTTAASCEEKIRVHVEAAADNLAVAFAREFEKRDELKRTIARYREERDAARFEIDAERRRTDAAAQAAEEAVAKAGSERDEAIERVAAVEDQLALLRDDTGGPVGVGNNELESSLTAALRASRDAGAIDNAALDTLLTNLATSRAIAAQQHVRMKAQLEEARRGRQKDVARLAEAEARSARAEAARAEALQAAAERRAAVSEPVYRADDLQQRDEVLHALRIELHSATRAKTAAEKTAKKSAHRVKELEGRLERDNRRCERLEAHAADLLSQLAYAERARAALASSKQEVAVGPENRLCVPIDSSVQTHMRRRSTFHAKKLGTGEGRLRDELRALRMENIELRGQRDELVDDVAHLKSELSRTRLVLMGLEHYTSGASASSATL